MTDADLALETGGYDHLECFICGDRIRVADPFDDRRVLSPDGGTAVVRIHRACGKAGVERWNRENRPHDGPLEASRREGWSWHSEPPTRLEG